MYVCVYVVMMRIFKVEKNKVEAQAQGEGSVRQSKKVKKNGGHASECSVGQTRKGSGRKKGGWRREGKGVESKEREKGKGQGEGVKRRRERCG